jgi:hypothetical protein
MKIKNGRNPKTEGLEKKRPQKIIETLSGTQAMPTDNKN